MNRIVVAPKVVGQVVFSVLEDGNCQVAIGGQITITNLATVLGIATSHLSSILHKSMGGDNGIVMANGAIPAMRG